MSEPGAGSDLQGIADHRSPDGDSYVLIGQKTFISNGINADLVVVVAKTDPAAGHRGISLFVVERGMAGFERGRNLDKIGLKAQDTAELFFSDVRVPVDEPARRGGWRLRRPDAEPSAGAARIAVNCGRRDRAGARS